MQRNRRKLSDIFHRCIPRQAIVKIRDDSDVDSSLTGFLDDADNKFFVPGNGEKDLVNKQRTCKGQAVADVTDYIGITKLRFALSESNEALEPKAEVLERLQMISERMRHSPRTDDQNIAGLNARKAAAIEASSLNRPSHAKQNG